MIASFSYFVFSMAALFALELLIGGAVLLPFTIPYQWLLLSRPRHGDENLYLAKLRPCRTSPRPETQRESPCRARPRATSSSLHDRPS